MSLTLLEKIDLYLGEEITAGAVAAPHPGTVTTDIAPNPNRFVVGAAPVRRKKKRKKKPATD